MISYLHSEINKKLRTPQYMDAMKRCAKFDNGKVIAFDPASPCYRAMKHTLGQPIKPSQGGGCGVCSRAKRRPGSK